MDAVDQTVDIDTMDAVALRAEVRRLRTDIACRPDSLRLLYRIREALGLNHYFPLSQLHDHIRGRDVEAKHRALPGDAPALRGHLDELMSGFGAAPMLRALSECCDGRANHLRPVDAWHHVTIERLRNESRIFADAAERLEAGHA